MIVLKNASQPANRDDGTLTGAVQAIVDGVRNGGDRAVQDFTRRFDKVDVKDLRVSAGDISSAYARVPDKTVEALKFAAGRIRGFAEEQLRCLKPLECESMPGVVLGHRLIPVESCGAYVPGGRHPLPSSALMSIIPAKVAGVTRVAACSPPSRAHGGIHPVVLVAMDLAGADEVYCMGGAQAVAAFAYGSGSVPLVDMIVGPGNMYVTEAKRILSGRVGIDMLAGPSEVLVIADESASPRLVAIDLLAQCEHDPSSRGVLVTASRILADQVIREVVLESRNLETGPAALKAWEENGQVILVDNLDEAVAVAESFAPEHLELHTLNNDELAGRLRKYGSLLIGEHAAVAFGDYVSGTNHILPTLGCARFASGVWVGTFIKVASYQKITGKGAARLAGACSQLAEVEGLAGHRRSVEMRAPKC